MAKKPSVYDILRQFDDPATAYKAVRRYIAMKDKEIDPAEDWNNVSSSAWEEVDKSGRRYLIMERTCCYETRMERVYLASSQPNPHIRRLVHIATECFRRKLTHDELRLLRQLANRADELFADKGLYATFGGAA